MPTTAPSSTPTPLAMLHELRDFGGTRETVGLADDVVEAWCARCDDIVAAIEDAWQQHRALRPEWGDALAGDEATLCRDVQADYVNFYPDDAIQPYVALAAKGPWIVTTHGAVLHDSGGYGMLGFGHDPAPVRRAMARPHVIANVMTPSLSHARFAKALRREVGHTSDTQPYHRFVCMNSGSEAVTVAARIADIRAHRVTDGDGPRAGAPVRVLGLQGGFHGRTDRPAQFSSSSARTYRRHLHTFQGRENLVTVPPNDVEALEAAFAQAEEDGVFFELVLMEPVMGEGRPGLGITRAFYDAARRLSRAHGAFLLVDSIQAGLRAHGVLSIVDYPGFEGIDPPDMETWSKALNAAQFPLSVLALSEAAAGTYVQGVYGNTMTTNPRALEVGTATLGLVTDAVRTNIRERGAELVSALRALQREFPSLITHVQGTGLLVSADLDPARVPIMGDHGIERLVRTLGLNVIHGGENALRFTPWFRLTSGEIGLMVDVLRQALTHYAKSGESAA